MTLQIMASIDNESYDTINNKNIYSKIVPDLSCFTTEELEKALNELDNL